MPASARVRMVGKAPGSKIVTNKLTFAQFVFSLNITNNARGEMILEWIDLIRFGKFPDIKTWSDLREFVKDDDQRDIARLLWRNYLNQVV